MKYKRGDPVKVDHKLHPLHGKTVVVTGTTHEGFVCRVQYEKKEHTILCYRLKRLPRADNIDKAISWSEFYKEVNWVPKDVYDKIRDE